MKLELNMLHLAKTMCLLCWFYWTANAIIIDVSMILHELMLRVANSWRILPAWTDDLACHFSSFWSINRQYHWKYLYGMSAEWGLWQTGLAWTASRIHSHGMRPIRSGIPGTLDDSVWLDMLIMTFNRNVWFVVSIPHDALSDNFGAVWLKGWAMCRTYLSKICR